MLSAVSLLLVGCANYDSDINRIDEELDRIENTRIKSLSEQIDRINVSLPELEQTDKDLKDMIKSLEGTAGDLQKAIAENGMKIEAVNADLAKALDELRNTDNKDKEEVMAALTAAKAEIIARLDAMKTEAEKKLEAVNGTIAALQEKDTQLEKKISDLKDYADNVLAEAKEHADKGIAGAKDWALATFSTLESQKAIEEDIASIKGSVEGLKASVADLEKRLTEKFSKDLETAVAGLDSKISEQVTALTAAYTNAISTAKTEIETAYTAAIKSAIENLEASLKDWVNETLTGYSTVAATEAGIAALKDDLEGQLSGQKAYLEGLLTSLSNDMTKNNAELKKLVDANAKAIEANKKAIEESAKKITQLESDLAAAKTEIKTAYEKAISDGIREVDNVRMNIQLKDKRDIGSGTGRFELPSLPKLPVKQCLAGLAVVAVLGAGYVAIPKAIDYVKNLPSEPKQEEKAAASAEQNAAKAPLDKVVVEMEASGSCWTEVTADGKEIFAGMLQAKEKKTFEAKDKLIVKYGNIGVMNIKSWIFMRTLSTSRIPSLMAFSFALPAVVPL